MTEIQPGELDRRVTLQSSTTTKSSVGQQLHTWSDVATVWAKVVEEAGEETREGRDAFNRQQLRVIIRFRSGLSDSMRLVYGGNNFEITSVREMGRRQWHIINCKRTGGRTGA